MNPQGLEYMATKHMEQVEIKGVTRKSYRIQLPVIGWTEWKVYTPDSFLDDMAWLATNSHNYTVVFRD